MKQDKSTPAHTLRGIKRSAKRLQARDGLQYCDALDCASRLAGYQNFIDAHRKLSSSQPQMPRAFISAYWRSSWDAGRLTLELTLSKPLELIVSKFQLPFARNLGGYRMEFGDHVERRVDLDSKDSAKESICAVARAIRFMEVSGLRPTTNRKQAAKFYFLRDLPGVDHGSTWIDQASGEWFFMDEPYSDDRLARRMTWVRERALYQERPKWEGIYSPGNSHPYFTCKDPSVLEAKLNAVSALKPIDFDKSDMWSAGPYDEPFCSPMRMSNKKKRRGRPMPSPRWVVRNGAVPYGAVRGGQSSEWRPAVRMSLRAHLEIGPLLASLERSIANRVKADSVGVVRNTLDDWLQMEYPRGEMSAEQFHAAYYGEDREAIDGVREQLKVLRKVIQLLTRGYSQCKPRDRLIDRLSVVESHLVTLS